ncbi:MAG TPA: hypothetical protein VF840_03845 [Terriglobales bacterium]
MHTDDPNLIYAYTDADAINDGVLVPWAGPEKVNRITRAVFDHFTHAMGSSPLTGPVTDVGRLARAVEAMVKIVPNEDGWRTGAFDGRELWLLPNEVGGLTLMFPEDY